MVSTDSTQKHTPYSSTQKEGKLTVNARATLALIKLSVSASTGIAIGIQAARDVRAIVAEEVRMATISLDTRLVVCIDGASVSAARGVVEGLQSTSGIDAQGISHGGHDGGCGELHGDSWLAGLSVMS